MGIFLKRWLPNGISLRKHFFFLTVIRRRPSGGITVMEYTVPCHRRWSAVWRAVCRNPAERWVRFSCTSCPCRSTRRWSLWAACRGKCSLFYIPVNMVMYLIYHATDLLNKKHEVWCYFWDACNLHGIFTQFMQVNSNTQIHEAMASWSWVLPGIIPVRVKKSAISHDWGDRPLNAVKPFWQTCHGFVKNVATRGCKYQIL